MNITVENLTKEYGPQKAVDNISLVYAELGSASLKLLTFIQLSEILKPALSAGRQIQDIII
jgi:hypothetical protein